MSAFELPCCLLLALGVLVRYNLRSMPAYDQRGDLVDVMLWLRALRVGKPAELRVQVVSNAHGASRWVQGRLVAERLPDKEAEEARRRVRREHGSAATAEMLETAGYVVLFTTASRGVWEKLAIGNTAMRTRTRNARPQASRPRGERSHSMFEFPCCGVACC